MATDVPDPHWTPYIGPLIEKGIALSSARLNPRQRRRRSNSIAVDGIFNPHENLLSCTSGRVILAMTNPPHKIVRKRGHAGVQLEPRGGSSALYSSITYLINETNWDPVLVSWPGEWQFDAECEGTITVNDDLHEELQDEYTKVTGCTVKPVWMEKNSPDTNVWRQYAEDVIWPTLHYIQASTIYNDSKGVSEEQDWWRRYVRLNEAYRDIILQTYRPGDVIWIHDYYLLLLPQLLRMALPKATIGMFLHAPFSSSEYFRCIPQRNGLLEGMLGANLVGFQSTAYCGHFISACTRLLGIECLSQRELGAFGVHVSVEPLPIGIDTKKVAEDAFQSSIDEKVKAIRALYPDKKIIVGRDRLDSVRGVVQKLQAFEMFLQMYPEWREKVILIQVTNPSYSTAARVETQVSELVAHINGTYGMLHFAPVHHYPQHIAKEEYLALLRVADLGLITSVRDGMNTTSLEFIVCQKDNHSPLILSEFTGTAECLYDAIQVNPWDSLEVAETIHKCLTRLDTDRDGVIECQRKLYEHVTRYTVQNWVSGFLTTLIDNVRSHSLSHVTPLLDLEQVKKAYTKPGKKLFLFDYDGTLTPIVKEPSAAIPSAKLNQVLQALSSDDRNMVWIISGRDQQFLDTWIASKFKNISLSAEHGSFVKEAGKKEWTNLTISLDMSWRDQVFQVFTTYTEKTPGATIEKKKASITWHYRRADPALGAFQAKNLIKELENGPMAKYDVEVMAGKANVEVRPREFNKGEIVKRIVKECLSSLEFVFCIGDDATDEDMFRALQVLHQDGQERDHVFAVTVGPPSKRTLASWHLLDPASVLESLSAITGISIYS